MDSLIYSFFAGISTVLGAIIALLFRTPGNKTLAALLGFAGGIMLAISFFDLLPEALEFGTMTVVVLGFLVGVGLMYALDIFIPHAHISNDEKVEVENGRNVLTSSKGPDSTSSAARGTNSTSSAASKASSGGNNSFANANSSILAPDNKILRTGFLIFLGIAIHNLPEGLAIGAGLEASPELGLYIAIAIGLHNIPEGIAVAGPLRAGGLSVIKVIFLTLLAGLMAPVGAAIGLLFFGISPLFVAGGLAFASGAMVYIVHDELVPQAHTLHAHIAIGGLMAGLLLGFILTA